jgi:hypothetical protein
MFQVYSGLLSVLLCSAGVTGCVSTQFVCNLVDDVGCHAVSLEKEKPSFPAIPTSKVNSSIPVQIPKQESLLTKKTNYIRLCISYGFSRVDCEDNWNNKL